MSSNKLNITLGLCIIYCIFIVSSSISMNRTHNACVSNTSEIFMTKLLQLEGISPESITKDSLQMLLGHWAVYSDNDTCFSSANSHTSLKKCFDNHCLSIDDLLHIYNITDDGKFTPDILYELSPALVYLSKVDKCHNKTSTPTQIEENNNRKKPSAAETWGYGFLFVTLINICSLVGALVQPCIKKSYYKQLLIFMVGLAVGSLAASGLLVLIPEALELMYIEEHGTKDKYVWRATVIMGGVYLFFLIERFLKWIFDWKDKHNALHEDEDASLFEQSQTENINDDDDDDDHTQISSIKSKTPVSNSTKYRDNVKIPGNLTCSNLPTSPTSESQITLEDNEERGESLSSINCDIGGQCDKGQKLSNGHLKAKKPPKGRQRIATVAWMIIFGDGLHNFIDGLSIGAAFTENTLAGISISLAVICEELPHELGDFAILLNSGMSFKKALMYNFLSACMCYLGLVVGTLLGENTSSHHWIFAIAGGMFLYISLVDMMPEMNSAAESKENKKAFGQGRIFLLQNAGILIGFGVILIMVLFGGEINFE